ncbi:hypothetical protein BH09BAC4_BH09BAC4_27850 [soil metagenome]
MNLLGKPHRNLTKRLLNPLTKPLLVRCLPSLIGTLSVAFSLNFQTNALPISVQILLFVISVACIAIAMAAHWQVQMHHLKGRRIHIRTGQNEKLHRLLVAGSDQLHPKTKKEASFRCDFSSVLLAFDQPRTANTNVITNGYGKRINQLLAAQVECFEEVSQLVKQHAQGSSQPMQASVKGRLFQPENTLLISHVEHDRGLVASEETGRYNGSGQHDAVTHFRSCLGLYTALIFSYFDEIIIGTGRPAKSNKLPLLSQT